MPYSSTNAILNGGWNTVDRRHRGLPFIANTPSMVYAGPGDVVGNAVACWSLRAYTNASIGGNALTLRRDSDNSTQTFVTVAGGGIDLTGITTFKGSANIFITKHFDQTGNGHDITQATAAVQPALILSGQGSLPVVRWNISNAQGLTVTSLTQAQPFTISVVSKRTANFTSPQDHFISVGNPEAGFRPSANLIGIFAGTAVETQAATDSAYHAVQWVVNGASTDINVDGTSNIVSSTPGTGGLSGIFQYGNVNNSGSSPGYDSTEIVLWGSAFSTTNSSNMSSNQHSYWGF